MYLIPKNIKTKREIFKGFGIFECIAVAIALGIGYLLTLFVPSYKLKVIFFCVPPLLTFLLLLPLPNGSTALNIFRKFLRFKKNQRCYKVK
ncbi:MAG: PrgI family protein [Bacilli bacterium]|nr:PrgI family protein [Bacilli bacterium]MBR5663071.1 PrgI family protein [Bacilli bacterium]